MSSDQAFFIYPHVEKSDAVRAELERLAKLSAILLPGGQAVFEDLLHSVEGKQQFAHLAPHLNAFEFVLLCMIAELNRRLRELDGHGWVHPPFP